MNCVSELINSDHIRSERPAVVFFKNLKSIQNKRLNMSFSQIYDVSLKAQSLLLNKGISKGDCVILFEKPEPALYAFIIGALGLGVKLLVVEPWMPKEKFSGILKKHQPKAALAGKLGKIILSRIPQFKNVGICFSIQDILSTASASVFHIEEMKETDPAIVSFTSGSSGEPKGVSRDHGYLVRQRTVLKKYLEYNDLTKLDLTVFSNLTMLNLILGKGSLVVDSKWSEETLQGLDELPEGYIVDTLATAPEFLRRLIKATKKLSLSHLHIGGALGNVRDYQSAINRFPEAEMKLVYGSTEAEPVSFCDLKLSVKKSKENRFFQAIYLGSVIDEIKTEIDSHGVLWVSGPHVSGMYLGDEESNKKNKKEVDGVVWHCMGDKIKIKGADLWYMGRDFQSSRDFELEQKLYRKYQRDNLFVQDGVIYSEDPLFEQHQKIKIIRDSRHRSRIDRKASLQRGKKMENYLTFIKERVPVVANLILALGLIFSVGALNSTYLDFSDAFFIGMTLMAFIIELRFMDEIKDFEKDKVAHPDRPLPRGLVTPRQVMNLIYLTFFILTVCTGLSFVLYGTMAGGFLLTTIFWMILMYKEFFMEKTLGKSPIIYAITHQVIIVPVCLFAISIPFSNLVFTQKSLGFCLLVLSSFFTFEVGRKMDPNAHPILGTYLIYYKKALTNLLITVLAGVGVLGCYYLDIFWWGFIPFILTVLTQARIWFQTERFKDLEGMIALNLIYNMWVVAIAWWVN